MKTRIRPDSHAVVAGAGIAGLLAARVLSERFTHVTVVEKDEPRASKERHPHVLLTRGYRVLEELLPGIGTELIARGAVPIDPALDIVRYHHGRRIYRAPSTMVGLLASRPLFESCIRARLEIRPRIEFVARTEVVGLREHDGRIVGVRLAGLPTLPARLVVDATGRVGHGTGWLAELGYPEVPKEIGYGGLTFTTREYRREPGEDFAGIVALPHGANPVGTVTVAAERDRWLVSLLGTGEPRAFEEYASGLDDPWLRRLLTTTRPLTDPVTLRTGPAVRRRYERCDRLPEGFIPLGDALCATNPVHAQGITTAALAAQWLRACLRYGANGLTRRYVNGVREILDTPWDLATGADLGLPGSSGRLARVRLLGAYLTRVRRAATVHPAVGSALLRAQNLLAGPASLTSPGMLRRVWCAGRPDPVPAPVEHPEPVPARFWP